MPHSASAKKRHRQNLRNRDRNRAMKSEIKTRIRRVLDALTAGDVTAARERVRDAGRTVDRAASKGTIHRNRAARIKSRLSARVKAASPAGGKPAAAKAKA